MKLEFQPVLTAAPDKILPLVAACHEFKHLRTTAAERHSAPRRMLRAGFKTHEVFVLTPVDNES